MNEGIFLLSEHFPPGSVVRNARFSYLDEADCSQSQSLVYCQTLHFLEIAAANPNVSAIVTTPALAWETIAQAKGLIVAENPRFLFFQCYCDFQKAGLGLPEMDFGIGESCRIHPSAYVSSRARLGSRIEVGPNAVIEDFVEVMDDVTIGPNVVIGAEGLITLRREDERLLIVRHAGGVEIGQGSQILAGAVIAKSLFRSFTRIGKHCQIGILANVGHGVSIGDNSVISGNSVIAGRVKIGNSVWVGASASVAQGLEVGEGAQIKMGSVVIGNVEARAVVSGNFAVPHTASMRSFFKIKSYEKR
jgi:acyl-[acyl carrier protein]--UDP-N-acetylglucosamine O-acyltransferase